MERMRHYRPWELLLLIKWTVIYGEYTSPDRHHLTEPDYTKLVNLLFQFGADIRMPDQYDNVLLFLRNMAFQEFWLQENARNANLARQSILFRVLEPNHSLHVAFKAKTGVTIDEFILLANMLLTGFLTSRKEQFVTENWFSPVLKEMTADSIRAFLHSLSKDIQSLRQFLAQPAMSRLSKAYEFYEQTPLKRYPLFLDADRYFTYSPIVLFHALHSYVFDLLREVDPSAFMDRFGPIFERYIEKGLQYAQLNFVPESELRTIMPELNKVIDFFVVDQGTNILLEAKGIEMPPIGMLTHLPDVVRDRTKTSIIKAIYQAHETWSILRKKSSVGRLTLGEGLPVLLVTTFKDLYIGNGSDFMRSVASDLPNDLAARFGQDEIIPPERIYFLSVEDFDLLIEAAHKGLSVSSILLEAMKADSQSQTKRFVFRQHLRALRPELGIPQYLEREFETVMNRIKQMLDEPPVVSG